MLGKGFSTVENSAGGRGVLGLIFAGYVPKRDNRDDLTVNFHHEHSILPTNCPWVSEDRANIIDPILVTSGQTCNFHDLNLVTFYLISTL